MRVPLSWLNDLVDLSDVSQAQLAQALTSAGLQVEKIERIGSAITGPVVVGKVVDFVEEPQKNGKLIRWCQVDVGESEPRGIICGAHNFKPGDYVVVALPGAVLPGGFEIAARKTYGHISDGMMCALDELGLGEDHSGIIILPEQIDGETLVLGADALDVLKVRDDVLEIDVTPDLGYCMSIRGIAREVAQAFGKQFDDPYVAGDLSERGDGYPVLLESDTCSLFAAVSVNGLDTSAQTPMWMQRRLNAAGMRPISLAVDITNYVMLESGQPLHAYDAKKLNGPIRVRTAREGETLVTLDNQTRQLSSDDLLITDDSGPIGLAGVMGGATTEITEESSSILLEGAAFDPVSIGRTFRRHKLPSEASARFARGVDPALGLAAAIKAAELLRDLGGATIEDKITVAGTVLPSRWVEIPADLPARILGTDISVEKTAEILTASGIDVALHDNTFTLTPPTWRRDLNDPYDFVEEVGCKIGFDAIEPRVPIAPAGRGYTFEQRSRRAVVDAVVNAGFVEVITLPFIGADDLDKLQVPDDHRLRRVVKLANPLADTQPYMRTSLLPGLFAALARNTSRSQNDCAIFECGSVFVDDGSPAAPMPDVTCRPSADEIAQVTGNLPDQPRMIAAVLSGNWLPARWNRAAEAVEWTHAVFFARTVAYSLGLDLQVEADRVHAWHPGRCAKLMISQTVIGWAGELHPRVIKAFGLPDRTCAVELDLDAMIDLAPRSGQVSAISPYPMDKEDIALIVDESVPASRVHRALVDGAGELLESIRLFDVFTGGQIGEGKKSLAFALGFRAPDHTMTEKEAVELKARAVEKASKLCGAVQRI